MVMSLVEENLVTLYPELVVISMPLGQKILVKHSSVFGKKISNCQIGCGRIKVE
jgi:hypothetical protein